MGLSAKGLPEEHAQPDDVRAGVPQGWAAEDRRAYKTNAANEFTWCGNLGSELMILTSRVRLNEPLESFVTSSNHRLRDSHVGRFGHWIEIIVRGRCSDAELALIRRLAQPADTRRVIVRRYGPRVRRAPGERE